MDPGRTSTQGKKNPHILNHNHGIKELQARDSCSPEEAAEHGIAGGDARLLARLSLSLFSSLVCHHMFEEISLIRLRGTAPICCLMFEELEEGREGGMAPPAVLEICGRSTAAAATATALTSYGILSSERRRREGPTDRATRPLKLF